MCILRNTHIPLLLYSQKNKKIKQEPLEKAKLFTRFSEMELLGRFCVVFSVLSL